MNNNLEIKAETRPNNGTSSARALRRAGKIPAILYGDGESQSLAFDDKTLSKLAYSGNFMTTLLSIDIEGKIVRAIPRETQTHPLNGKIMHVDFMRLAANARIDVDVAVNFINEELSPGLKRGGVLNIVRHQIELSCPAENIPDDIVADLEGLDIGDSIHISQIKLPGNVETTITDRDFTIATIAAPASVRSEEEEEGAEEGAETEATESTESDSEKSNKENSD